MGSGTDRLQLKSYICCLLAVWPWAYCLTTLKLSFIWRTEIISASQAVALSRAQHEDRHRASALRSLSCPLSPFCTFPGKTPFCLEAHKIILALSH